MTNHSSALTKGMSKSCTLILCIFLSLVLAACGGGGGGGSSSNNNTNNSNNTNNTDTTTDTDSDGVVDSQDQCPNTVAGSTVDSNGCRTGEAQLDLPDVDPVSDPNAITPATAVSEMGIGINLGNTLDAPFEGDWAKAAEQRYIQDFKSAGFNHVRIPVRWDNHIGESLPYTIDTSFMDRVEEIVDWALDEDLYVILNAHHDDWVKVENPSQALLNRFDSIWMQVTERFKNKSPKLMFEILNEPHGMTIEGVNTLNVRVLSIIRNANPTRLVVYSGNGYTPLDDFLAAAIPNETDQYLIGNFHSYDPWPFAGQCVRGWGTQQDHDALESIYQRAQDWVNANGIPVMVNEFGAAKYDFENPQNICDLDERLDYIEAHVSFASERGIGATFWDDGGSFSTYDRDAYSWGPEKDVLVVPNLSQNP